MLFCPPIYRLQRPEKFLNRAKLHVKWQKAHHRYLRQLLWIPRPLRAAPLSQTPHHPYKASSGSPKADSNKRQGSHLTRCLSLPKSCTVEVTDKELRNKSKLTKTDFVVFRRIKLKSSSLADSICVFPTVCQWDCPALVIILVLMAWEELNSGQEHWKNPSPPSPQP